MNISQIPCFGQRQGWCKNQSTHVLTTKNLLLHFCSECVEKPSVKSLAKGGTIKKILVLALMDLPEEEHNDILLNTGLSMELAIKWEHGKFAMCIASPTDNGNFMIIGIKDEEGKQKVQIIEGGTFDDRCTFVNDYIKRLDKGGKPYSREDFQTFKKEGK